MSPHPDHAPVLQFLGGVGTVTGSKYLVRAGTDMVLVDAGLFQGLRELRDRNWRPMSFDPAALDAVVVTHAHVDHAGYLPRLVAAGFRGPIYTTPSTAALLGIVLPDCAHLQEEEAAYANRKGYSKHHPALPLFTRQDAEATLRQISTVPFGIQHAVAEGVSLTFSRAGHILGAATVRLQIGDDGPVVVFSGDLGRPNHPFIVPPDPPPAADVLLVESTYGDRTHDDGDGHDELTDVIKTTVERGGSVLIPAFAVDRTEVILHHLGRMFAAGTLPVGIPVHVDSPMALAALNVYRQAVARGDPEIRPEVHGDRHVFDVPGLREVTDVEGSKLLNHPTEPSIVISASGMASGGRVVHHLAHWLPHRRHTVALVGYQAEGTRGRRLLDGATELKMLGRYVPVRAGIANVRQFSVHADAGELLDWIGALPAQPDLVCAVHGEPTASAALARAVHDSFGWTAVVPRLDERIRLDRPT